MKWLLIAILTFTATLSGCDYVRDTVNTYRNPAEVKTTVHVVVNMRKSGILIGGSLFDNKLTTTGKGTKTFDKRVVPGDYTITLTKGSRKPYTFSFSVPEGSKGINIVCSRSFFKFNRLRCQEVE